VPTPFCEAEGHLMGDDTRESFVNPAQSETSSMSGNSMRENRETSRASGSNWLRHKRGMKKCASRWVYRKRRIDVNVDCGSGDPPYDPVKGRIL